MGRATQAVGTVVGFFRSVFNSLGLDYTLIGITLFIGILLLANYAGANDTQTFNFIITYMVMGGAAAVFAFIAKATKWPVFIGAGYAIRDFLSADKNIFLALLYVFAFGAIGFFMAGGGIILANLFDQPQATGATGIVLKDGFAPIIEAYFFRGVLLPFLWAVATPILFFTKKGKTVAVVGGFLLANAVQAFAFMSVHLIASGGDTSRLLNHFSFGFGMGLLVAFVGILAEVAYHFGNNSAFVQPQTVIT